MPGQQRKLDRADQRQISAVLRAFARLDKRGAARLVELAHFIDPRTSEEHNMGAEAQRLNALVDMLEATRKAVDTLTSDNAAKDQKIATLTPDAEDVAAQQRADAWIAANPTSAPPVATAAPAQPAPVTPPAPVQL